MTTIHEAPARKGKTTDPTKTTAQAVEAATAALIDARDQRIAAQRKLADLLDRIDNGESASGIGELRDHVEVAQRIEAAKERALLTAKETHAEAVAEATADQVAAALGRDGSPTLVTDAQEEATTALVTALSIIPGAIEKRNAFCDAAGDQLNAVGVPTRKPVGRVWYDHVRAGATGRTIVGWNVSVDGVSYSGGRNGYGHSEHEGLRLTEDTLAVALRQMGIKLNGGLSRI